MNLSSWAVAALLLAPVTSAAAQAARSDPVLRSGDMLRLSVWRHPELSGDFLVAPDSTVVHPLYQRVQVVGVPLPVVKERLRALLVTYEQIGRAHVELQSQSNLVCRLLLEKKIH